MEWYNYLINAGFIILYVALAVLFVLIFIVLPIFIYSAVFTRQDRNKLLKYFAPEDFDLNVEELPITYRGQKLYGAIYTKKPIEECKKLIIFAHGFGPGHCAYMTEIAYYCNKGYAVVAYDNLGCDRSEGKNMRSFYTGAECVIAAYIAAKGHNKLKDLPVYLVGHSWGGYSILCASQKINVQGIVAFSPFNSSEKLIYNFGAKRLKFLGLLMMPSLALIGWFKNVSSGSKKAAKAVAKSGTPALIIWGEKDTTVPKSNSAACIAKGENIKSVILADKGHNVYNTVAAEVKLGELLTALNNVEQGNLTGEAAISYFADFDFVTATEEDEEVMTSTVDFIESL
jgi:pimeloyl-ACP methyl ester carboxylesterase